jgi:hypothetical protein
MKPSEVKFHWLAADLEKTQKFYSAIGMTWLGGEEVAIGKSGLPVDCEKSEYITQFPHLWGNLGNIEIVFYLETDFLGTHPRANSKDTGNSVLLVYYDEFDDVAKIIERLKTAGLFIPVRDDPTSPRIADPDGRVLELCPSCFYRL